MRIPKILWVNPSFLDYRIPLYKELYNLCNGQFYLVYSKDRVPQRCIDKIEAAIGDNALGLPHEKQIHIGGKGGFCEYWSINPFPERIVSVNKNGRCRCNYFGGLFPIYTMVSYAVDNETYPIDDCV